MLTNVYKIGLLESARIYFFTRDFVRLLFS